jgi:hypothetical protein
MARSQERKRLRELAGIAARSVAGDFLRAFSRGSLLSNVGAMVTLTRVSPRKLDDDNAIAGFKPVRDGVADAFGLRDDHKCLSWVYLQRKGPPAIEIRIEVTYGA